MLNRYDEDLSPVSPLEVDSTRLWVSDRQWMTILRNTEKARPVGVLDGPDRRTEHRYATDCRCILRWGGADSSGTYAVRARNISSGGLGFIHRQALPKDTRCTLALQPEACPGMIIAGRVAWCRPLPLIEADQDVYEIGIQFDTPVNLEPFGHVA